MAKKHAPKQAEEPKSEELTDEELEQQDGEPLEDREVMTILPIEPTVTTTCWRPIWAAVFARRSGSSGSGGCSGLPEWT